jgi:hypothetical protein
VIEPDALTFVIIGDLAKIERPIRALDLGEVQLIDIDGTAAYIGVPRTEAEDPPAHLKDRADCYPAEEPEMMPARHRPPTRSVRS